MTDAERAVLQRLVARTRVYMVDLDALSRTLAARYTDNHGRSIITLAKSEWARFDGALTGLRAVLHDEEGDLR